MAEDKRGSQGIMSLWGRFRVVASALVMAVCSVRPATAQVEAATVPLPPAAPSAAAPGAPDKTGFTLFNATPLDEMRAFETDRPGRSNSPYTVDAGHFQYETDLFVWSFANAGGVTTRLFAVADPVLKLGVLTNTDVEVAFGGYQTLRSTVRSTKTVLDADGIGDVDIRIKQNLLGNEGGLAVIPSMKIPTSSHYLGNNQVEGGLIATLQFNLPLDLSLILMSEVDLLKNAADSGKHANFTNLISLAHPIHGNLSGSLEFAAAVGTDAATLPAQTVDFTLSYALTPNLQIDAAFYVGLDRGAPARTAYIGLSQRL
jgi:hypothetical protein